MLPLPLCLGHGQGRPLPHAFVFSIVTFYSPLAFTSDRRVHTLRQAASSCGHSTIITRHENSGCLAGKRMKKCWEKQEQWQQEVSRPPAPLSPIIAVIPDHDINVLRFNWLQPVWNNARSDVFQEGELLHCSPMYSTAAHFVGGYRGYPSISVSCWT